MPSNRTGWWHWATLLAVIIAGLLVVVVLDDYYRGQVTLQAERQLARAASDAGQQLRRHMEQRLGVVEDLRSFLLATSELPDFDAFDRFAATLKRHEPSITALVYVDPDLILRRIYPAEGREKAIGLDLKKRPSFPFVRRVIEERRLLVDQPHQIIGGQIAIIARAPLFRGDQFFGLAQGVFVIPEIVRQDLGHLTDRYHLQLSDDEGQVFWGDGAISSTEGKTEVVRFGNASWVLKIAPRASTRSVGGFVLALIWIGGGLLTSLLTYLVHRNLVHSRALATAISEKTAELTRRNAELEAEIQHRHAIEASLRESETRLNEAQRIARIGSWEWDIGDDRVVWSDELHRIFGMTPGETELSYEVFLDRVHPEDRAQVKARVAASMAGDAWHENEYRIIRPDGSVRYLRGRSTITLSVEGRPVRMAGVAHDITEAKQAELARQESERRYQVLLENAGDGIAVADLQGRLIDANEKILRSLGYSKEEFCRLNASEIVVPEDRAGVRRSFKKMLTTGSDLAEYRILRKDGSTFPAEIAGTTVQLGGETVALGIFRDVSERKNLEQALYRYQTELEALVDKRTKELTVVIRELEAFSYSVSHDLRGPLRAINGFSQILEEDYGDRLDETGHGYIAKICGATERMGRLIDDLLQLSRTIRADLCWETVDFTALANEIGGELQTAEPERVVTFDVQPGMTAPADPTLARSLLENLLRNAWKFTRERNEAVIAVGAREQEGQPIFFVRDNGIGLDMADAGKLFQPFHRLHGPEYEGSGIGLATVQRIVQRHGGRIWVEGSPGGGATFHFTLGRHAPADAPTPPLAVDAKTG